MFTQEAGEYELPSNAELEAEQIMRDTWRKTASKKDLVTTILHNISNFRIPDFKHKLQVYNKIYPTGDEVERRLWSGTLFERPEPKIPPTPPMLYGNARPFWIVGGFTTMAYRGYLYLPPKENNYG